MTTTHSEFGPSGAYRWSLCPGSYNACKDLPDTVSQYAEEGHKAHALAEKCLRMDVDPQFLGHEYDMEMIDNVKIYVDYIRSLGSDIEVEQKVSYEEYVPGGFGTVDAIVTNGDTLHIVDLKYGKGVKVSAFESSQGILYALGVILEREAFQEFKIVVFHIVQPRMENIDSWTTTPEEIKEFGTWFKKRHEIAMSPDAERIPGTKQCQFCKAKPTCPAILKAAEETLMIDFDCFISIPTLENLDDLELKRVLDNKDFIINWLNSVEDHVFEKVMAGQQFPGYKIVNGRSNRKWKNEKEMEFYLTGLIADLAYEKKLITPAKAEKLVKKELLKDCIVKGVGKPTLVPDSDTREGYQNVTANDFEN